MLATDLLVGLRGNSGTSFAAAQQLAFSNALRTALNPYSIMSVAIESFQVQRPGTKLTWLMPLV